MTADEYWAALCRKNPALAEREVVTIRVSGIRAMVMQAHNMGMKEQAELSARFDEVASSFDKFSSFFGGGSK